MSVSKAIFAGVMSVAALGAVIAAAPAASAAPNPGTCQVVDVCLYYNSGYQGATFGDGNGNSQKPENYGAPNWYVFSGGSGAGIDVKNNAASVYNFDINDTATIYVNSNNTGPHQSFPPNTGGNLNSGLKNNEASQCLDFFQTCPGV